MNLYDLKEPAWLFGVGLTSREREIVTLVLALSRKGRTCTARAAWIAERLDMSERTAYRHLSELKRSGWLLKDGKGLKVRPPADVSVATDEVSETADAVSVKTDKMAVNRGYLVFDLREGHESKTVAADARAYATPPAPAPEAAAATVLYPSEFGRKGGEAPPPPSAEQAHLAPPTPPSPPPTPVETTPSEESHSTASALRAAGVDGHAPEALVAAHGEARVREVLRWAKKQRWAEDRQRRPREIIVALREGHGQAPEEGSEAAAVEKRDTIPLPTPEERAARRRRLAVMAIKQNRAEQARRLSPYDRIPEEEWAGYVEEARIELEHDREEWEKRDADPAWVAGQKANAMLKALNTSWGNLS